MNDEALRAALEEVDHAILASLPDPSECTHRFSDRFEKRMGRVRRRARHPGAYRFLRQAACFLLALLILFSSLMVFSPEARAAVFNWIREQFEVFSHYFYTAETPPSEERAEYELGWLPDGYNLLNSHTSDNKNTLLYRNESGQMIQLTYFYGTDANPLFLKEEDYDHSFDNVNGTEAEIYISIGSNKTNGIIWSDREKGILFYICAESNEEELVLLAEGVIKKDSK